MTIAQKKRSVNKMSRSRRAVKGLPFTPQEITELKNISDGAFLLMCLYYSQAQYPNPDLEDETISKNFEIPLRTVQRTRAKLTEAKWFLRFKSTKQGVTYISYKVGKYMTDDERNKAAMQRFASCSLPPPEEDEE